MSKPMPLSSFPRFPPASRARLVAGLPAAIDTVAESAAPSHRFLRQTWFAAALQAYGGGAETLLVETEGVPVIALPLVATGPRAARLASVPGCYWPFRSLPVSLAAEDGAWATLLDALAGAVNGVRIGPVYDDDAGVAALRAAAQARGWLVLGRRVAETYRLDVAALRAEGAWPRGSTLRKNRFHEKHLAAHGALDWREVSGADWPAGFDALAAVEEESWLATRTDGRDAKFTSAGHGAFWRAAAGDAVLRGMTRAALLTVDGAPAAFSFDLDAGALTYAIANSYDPVFGKHSPGKLVQWRNLARAAERGTALVDWGAGDSGYKAVLGAVEGPMIRDWLLLRPGVPALLGRLLRRRWEGSGN